MTSEYERLGGTLPQDLQAIVKEYARPRYMKPIPQAVAQLKFLNRDGGILNTWDDGSPKGKGKTCYLVLSRVLILGSMSSLKHFGLTKFHGPF